VCVWVIHLTIIVIRDVCGIVSVDYSDFASARERIIMINT
jgi:hypothetical protein